MRPGPPAVCVLRQKSHTGSLCHLRRPGSGGRGGIPLRAALPSRPLLCSGQHIAVMPRLCIPARAGRGPCPMRGPLSGVCGPRPLPCAAHPIGFAGHTLPLAAPSCCATQSRAAHTSHSICAASRKFWAASRILAAVLSSIRCASFVPRIQRAGHTINAKKIKHYKTDCKKPTKSEAAGRAEAAAPAAAPLQAIGVVSLLLGRCRRPGGSAPSPLTCKGCYSRIL